MNRFPAVPKFPLPAGTERGDNSIPAAEVEDEALDAEMIALGDRRRAQVAAKNASAASEPRPASGEAVAATAAVSPRT